MKAAEMEGEKRGRIELGEEEDTGEEWWRYGGIQTEGKQTKVTKLFIKKNYILWLTIFVL